MSVALAQEVSVLRSRVENLEKQIAEILAKQKKPDRKVKPPKKDE